MNARVMLDKAMHKAEVDHGLDLGGFKLREIPAKVLNMERKV